MAILNSPLQFISSIPAAARGFTLALALASLGRFLLASWFPESPFVLELVPGLIIWRPWTVITSPFVEVGLIEVRLSTLVRIRLIDQKTLICCIDLVWEPVGRWGCAACSIFNRTPNISSICGTSVGRYRDNQICSCHGCRVEHYCSFHKHH